MTDSDSDNGEYSATVLTVPKFIYLFTDNKTAMSNDPEDVEFSFAVLHVPCRPRPLTSYEVPDRAVQCHRIVYCIGVGVSINIALAEVSLLLPLLSDRS
jgi:hypothetical protein